MPTEMVIKRVNVRKWWLRPQNATPSLSTGDQKKLVSQPCVRYFGALVVIGALGF